MVTARVATTVVVLAMLAGCGSSPSASVAPPSVSTTAPATTVAATASTPASTARAPAQLPSPSPASTTVPPAPATATDCIRALPLELRAGQVLMVAVFGDRLHEPVPALDHWHVGAAVVMKWPEGSSPDQLRVLKRERAIPLLLAVDEEGGDVQRLRRLGAFPSARRVAATMSLEEAEAMIAAHATVVAGLGFDLVLAPVVDVSPLSGPDTIGSRAFSSDPSVVADFAGAYVRGWRSAGITPVLKHFPGHGSASADTHYSAAVTPSLDELAARDLVPYTSLADGGGVGVMVAHLAVPGLTDDEGVPASLSSAAIDGLLRTQLGFHDALVVTDTLEMDAVADRFEIPAAGVMSLRAGADIVMYAGVDQTGPLVEAVVAAVGDGRLAEDRLDEAVGRVLREKQIDPCELAVVP